MPYFLFLSVFSLFFTASGASGSAVSVTPVRVSAAAKSIESRLLGEQHLGGRWQGDFETTPMTDALLLAYGRLLGMDTRDIRAEALRSLDSQYLASPRGWPQWPGGPKDGAVTAQILGALTYAGETSYLARQGLAPVSSLNAEPALALHFLARMQLAPLGLVPEEALPHLPMKMLLLQNQTALRWPRIGVTGRGLIAYTLWRNASRAVRENRTEIFAGNHARRITRAIDAILATRGRDGTWYFLTETLISLAALEAAERAGCQRLTDVPLRATIEKAWQGLLGWRAKTQGGTLNLQPMLSTVWDTSLIAVVLSEGTGAGTFEAGRTRALLKARDWLVQAQLNYPSGSPLQKANGSGGWSFHHQDLAYPDVDDSVAALGSLMMIDAKTRQPQDMRTFQKGLSWVLAHQNKDGGFPVFTRNVRKWPMKLAARRMPVDNFYMDESQSDITARVVILLNHLMNDPLRDERISEQATLSELRSTARRACQFLRNSSEKVAGASLPLWSGDWFRNYLYGTSFAAQALLRAPCGTDIPTVEPYLKWFVATQNPDGGWGEAPNTYASESFSTGASALETTAFALLPLLDYLHLHARDLTAPLPAQTFEAVERGISFLLTRTRSGKDFTDPTYNAVIFKDAWYGRYGYVSTYGMLHVLRNWEALQHEKKGEPAGPLL